MTAIWGRGFVAYFGDRSCKDLQGLQGCLGLAGCIGFFGFVGFKVAYRIYDYGYILFKKMYSLNPLYRASFCDYAAVLQLSCLVAEWIHFTLFGIRLPTLIRKVYTFGGL